MLSKRSVSLPAGKESMAQTALVMSALVAPGTAASCCTLAPSRRKLLSCLKPRIPAALQGPGAEAAVAKLLRKRGDA